MNLPHSSTFFWRTLILWGLGVLILQGVSAQTRHQTELGPPAGISCFKCDPMAASISTHLLMAEAAYLRNNEQALEQLPTAIQIQDNAIRVELILQEDNTSIDEQLIDAGMTEITQFERMVGGWLPLRSLRTVAALPDVAYIHPAYAPIIHMGSTATQADTAQASDLARQIYGVDGRGIKIGIATDSYDHLGGASTGISNGDLPGPGNPNGYTTPVQIVAGYPYSSGGTDEGRAIAEIIHDIAPAAEMAFATALGTQADFANNIIALADANCDIIVDDVIYFASPFYQDGLVAQAADSVHSRGIAYYSAAGNQSDLGYHASIDPSYFDDQYNVHQFSGSDYRQRITVGPSATLTVVLQWDNPFTSVSGGTGPTADLDLYLLHPNGQTIAFSTNINTLGGDPVEIIQYTNTSSNSRSVDLVIAYDKYFSASEPNEVRYVIFDDGDISIDEYATNSPTGYGQCNAEGAISIGAAFWKDTPAYGQDPPLLQSFSSRGGMPIRFDEQGNSITPVVRVKPNLTAADGGNTSFFGIDTSEDPDTDPNFFGTSASVAHAAAAHALLLQAAPGSTPNELRDVLQSTAIDMETPGHDSYSGYGLLNVSDAIAELQTTFPVTLLGFEATVYGDRAMLSWEVADEYQLAGYAVDMATETGGFQQVAWVPAGALDAYQTTLRELQPQRYQLRLRMVDLDGTEALSDLREITVDQASSAWVCIKEGDQMYLTFPQMIDGPIELTMWDIQGRSIYQTHSTSPTMRIPLPTNLPDQHVFYRLTWQQDQRPRQQVKRLPRR